MKVRGFKVLTRREIKVVVLHSKLSHLLNCLPCPKNMHSYQSKIGVAIQIFFTSPHTEIPAILSLTWRSPCFSWRGRQGVKQQLLEHLHVH